MPSLRQYIVISADFSELSRAERPGIPREQEHHRARERDRPRRAGHRRLPVLAYMDHRPGVRWLPFHPPRLFSMLTQFAIYLWTHYRSPLLPIMEKNVAINNHSGNVHVAELNWLVLPSLQLR